MKYRIREDSLLDWIRAFGVGMVICGVLVAVFLSEYGVA